MKSKFFSTPAEFREWLEHNHDSALYQLIEVSAKGERMGLPSSKTKE